MLWDVCPKCGKKIFYENKVCIACGYIPRSYKKNEGFDSPLYKIYREAAYFYFRNINKSTLEYLKKRKIAKEDVVKFGLGYASYENPLWKYLIKDFPLDLLLKSGLVKQSENRGLYDFFRNRLIIPIIDENRRVISFGGRVFDDSKPKYLNTKETEIFSKKNTLYGINIAAKSNSDTLVICEGYMDTIAMQSREITNSVGVLGTALTWEHSQIIKEKGFKNIVLLFDMDQAGRNAVNRSLKYLQDFNVIIPNLKPAKDPDEFIKWFGKDKFLNRVKKGDTLDEYLIRNTDNVGKSLCEILLK